MARTQAPKCCAFIASSPGCQGVYVATSTLALALIIVVAFLPFTLPGDEGNGGQGPVVSWDSYVIQDWGDGKCSSGTRVDDIPSCQNAFYLYKAKCETKDGGPQVETWDGQPGCHMQDAGFAEFQFNANLQGDQAPNHAPVCEVGKQQLLKCYHETENTEGEETFGIYDSFEDTIRLLMIIPPIVMSVSRLCVPACCPLGMEDVPGCCPCNCFAQLDTSYLVTGGIMCATALGSVFVGRDSSVFEHFELLNMSLTLASVVTAIVKLCIMLDYCCQHCKSSMQGAIGQPTGEFDGPIIIGQPVTVTDPSAKLADP